MIREGSHVCLPLFTSFCALELPRDVLDVALEQFYVITISSPSDSDVS